MKLCSILYSTDLFRNLPIADINISSVETKPEKIGKDTLFVFIRSIKFDISNIIDSVFERSPAAIICDTELMLPKNDIPIYRVADTRRLLPFLYSRFFEIDYNRLTFIGVTGTNGKTSTATMLCEILKHAGKSTGFIGTGKIEIRGERITNENYSMTTPDPKELYSAISKMQQSGCTHIVMEVSSHALYFDKVLPITFNVAIMTNLSEEHLDFHEDMVSYFATKLKLFSQSKIGVFNMDDEYSRRAFALADTKTKRSVGVLKEGDTIATCVTLDGLRGSSYIYKDKKFLFAVKLKIGGAYNVYNSLMALNAAIAIGIPPYIAKEAINSMTKIDGRLEVISDDITVVIDYAHTETALENLLKFLNTNKNSGQKIVTLFGCGGERDKKKRPKMARVAEKYSDFCIVTSDNPRGECESEIIADIVSGFENPERSISIHSREDAIEYAIGYAEKNDIVAIVGKGHERYSIDKTGYHRFDEREIILRALKRRKDIIFCDNEN